MQAIKKVILKISNPKVLLQEAGVKSLIHCKLQKTQRNCRETANIFTINKLFNWYTTCWLDQFHQGSPGKEELLGCI